MLHSHELYAPPAIAYDIHTNFSKKTKRYLTSNAFIHITGDYGVNNTVPIGCRSHSLNKVLLVVILAC